MYLEKKRNVRWKIFARMSLTSQKEGLNVLIREFAKKYFWANHLRNIIPILKFYKKYSTNFSITGLKGKVRSCSSFSILGIFLHFVEFFLNLNKKYFKRKKHFPSIVTAHFWSKVVSFLFKTFLILVPSTFSDLKSFEISF